VLVLASVTASAQNRLPNNAQRALQWLQCTQQQSNGQIGSGGNPIAHSSEVAFGLAAAGQDAAAMKTGVVSLADYLKTAVSTDVGTNGELLIARASQPDAGPTASVITQLDAAKGSNGEYGADLYSDALAILGLRAANQAVGQDAVTFLKDHQQSDGGWGFGGDQYTDANPPALAIQALAQLAGLQVASGADTGAISNPYSKLFATTFAPAAFLLRPLTIGGIAETAVPLLACPASSTATPTRGVTTARLAQTGAAADIRAPLGGLGILLLGAGILRSRRRAPRR